MQHDQPAQTLVVDHDIRNLKRHPHDEREIAKIPKIRVLCTWKLETATPLLSGALVEEMRVVRRQSKITKHPGKKKSRYRKEDLTVTVRRVAGEFDDEGEDHDAEHKRCDQQQQRPRRIISHGV